MPEDCPICRLESPNVGCETQTTGDFSVYNCERCKAFKISRTAETAIRTQGLRLPFVSAWIRDCNEYDDEQPFVTTEVLKSISANEPDRSDETNSKRLLRFINKNTDHLGAKILIVEHFDFPIIYGLNEYELRSYLRHLIDQGFVEYADTGSLGDSFAYQVKITVAGRAKLNNEAHHGITKHTPTQWTTVNQYLDQAYDNLDSPGVTAKHKNCAHSCREAIVALSNEVYDQDEHGDYEKARSSYSNALTQLELFYDKALGGGKRKEQRSAAKKALDLASKCAHSDSVEFSQASTCYSATKAVIEITNTNAS